MRHELEGGGDAERSGGLRPILLVPNANQVGEIGGGAPDQRATVAGPTPKVGGRVGRNRADRHRSDDDGGESLEEIQSLEVAE